MNSTSVLYTFNVYHGFVHSNMKRYIPRRIVLIPDIQNASFSETNEQGNQLACNYLIETCVFLFSFHVYFWWRFCYNDRLNATCDILL